MPTEIEIIPLPALQDNYIWALTNRVANKVAIVDPGEAGPVLDFLQQTGLSLQAVFLTHHHGDHSHGIKALKQRYQMPVFASPLSPFFEAEHALEEGRPVSLEYCPLPLRVIAIPGHTLDHQAYYAPGYLFSGDTLFASGCGRVFEGTFSQMYDSLQKLAALPADTQLYCGHEYTEKNLRFAEWLEPDNADIQARLQAVKILRAQQQSSLPSNLAVERLTNPFLRCESPTLHAQAEKLAGQSFASPEQLFIWLRKSKDQF